MKKVIVSILLGLGISLSAGSVQAIIIGFDPPVEVVPLGEPAVVDIIISGLGDFAPPSLSIFDLDVSFDNSILGFGSVTFGDPMLGDQLDPLGLGSITADTPGVGTVNLFELSFDDPLTLDTLQAGSFTLATLSFDTLGLGTSPLGLTINALGDASGDPLEQVRADSGAVSVVPEPATFLLMGAGLAGIAGLRRKRPSK